MKNEEPRLKNEERKNEELKARNKEQSIYKE
jgi:hypothetical protein